MSRTRTYRPEFWTSDQVIDCSRDARLTFLGLLSFCDDNGIHPASSRQIRMRIYPGDDIGDDDVAGWINELIEVGLLAIYEVGGIEYLAVTGWNRHQKIDKPTFRHPLPDGTQGKFSDELRRAFAESSPTNRRILADASTRKQSKAKERKFPSHGGECLPPMSTTEIEGGDFADAPKPRHRKFVAMAGGAE